MNHDTEILLGEPAQKTVVLIGEDALTARIVSAVFRCTDVTVNYRLPSEGDDVEPTEGQFVVDSKESIVLLNMDAEHLDGVAVARQLRTNGFCGPIIAMTKDEQPQTYIDAGFDEYLRKPIQPFALISLVEKLG